MPSSKNLTTNNTQNFILKGFNSIQIGLYMLLGVYVINASILGFIADSNPLGMLSIEIIESICMFMVVLVVFFSMFAVFFSYWFNIFFYLNVRPWRNGRRAALRSLWGKTRGSSSLLGRTISISF